MRRTPAGLGILLISATAAAAPIATTVPAPPSGIFALGHSTIFLNRCPGGCSIKPGAGQVDDATIDQSGMVNQPSVLREYTGFQAGEWEAVVQCVREVYSPYDVEIVDTRPATGATYSEILVGGSITDIGMSTQGVGGLAFLSIDCGVSNPKGVAFAFTDQIDVFAREDGNNRVNGLCWIVAQETAHVYGLDHEYQFTDGASACSDPMTYRDDCGGQKFFRNRDAACGGLTKTTACGPTMKCGPKQNSHAQLTTVFGAATPITAAPTVAITSPAEGSTVAAGSPIVAKASSPRGIATLELFVNGFRWGDPVKGIAFNANGQPESSYSLLIPAALPDSILDLEVHAYDDIGLETISNKIRVTKGAPGGCVDASTCAKGQNCTAGLCAWDPPSGQFGDTCSYDQFCVGGLCTGTATDTICTHTCTLDATGNADPSAADACLAGYDCDPLTATSGVCFPHQDGGCCSVGGHIEPAALAVKLGLGLGALGFVLRRRRRVA